MDTTTIYPEFSPGQKVRTCYGETRTVLFQNGCQVFVEEECNGWYHPTKVWAVPLVNNQPNIANLRRRSGCGWRMTTRTPRGWLADQKQPKAPSR